MYDTAAHAAKEAHAERLVADAAKEAIHLRGMIVALRSELDASGAMNGTAPRPVTNKEFSKALGRALHRPSVLPVPSAPIYSSGPRVSQLPDEVFQRLVASRAPFWSRLTRAQS